MANLDDAHTLEGRFILVVEDDFLISTELDAILTAAGAHVLGPCRTAAQAQRAIQDNAISGAVLDFRLNGETTVPVARQLHGQGIPFLFFTGQKNIGRIHAECPEAEIITKPFEPHTIVEAVAAMLH